MKWILVFFSILFTVNAFSCELVYQAKGNETPLGVAPLFNGQMYGASSDLNILKCEEDTYVLTAVDPSNNAISLVLSKNEILKMTKILDKINTMVNNLDFYRGVKFEYTSGKGSVKVLYKTEFDDGFIESSKSNQLKYYSFQSNGNWYISISSKFEMAYKLGVNTESASTLEKIIKDSIKI